MARLESRGVICGDSLEVARFGQQLMISGHIGLPGDLVISVQKLLRCISEIDDPDPRVQTEEYAYNAFVCGRGNVLRYDNQHKYPGHPDAHHKHVFDWKTGREREGSPEWIGRDNWPTLNEVIEEVSGFCHEFRSELPNPDVFPDLSNARIVS